MDGLAPQLARPPSPPEGGRGVFSDLTITPSPGCANILHGALGYGTCSLQGTVALSLAKPLTGETVAITVRIVGREIVGDGKGFHLKGPSDDAFVPNDRASGGVIGGGSVYSVRSSGGAGWGNHASANQGLDAPGDSALQLSETLSTSLSASAPKFVTVPRSAFIDPATWSHDDPSLLIDRTEPVWSHSSPAPSSSISSPFELLASGNHSFPFSIPLPHDLPGTFHSHQARIRYVLHVDIRVTPPLSTTPSSRSLHHPTHVHASVEVPVPRFHRDIAMPRTIEAAGADATIVSNHASSDPIRFSCVLPPHAVPLRSSLRLLLHLSHVQAGWRVLGCECRVVQVLEVESAGSFGRRRGAGGENARWRGRRVETVLGCAWDAPGSVGEYFRKALEVPVLDVADSCATGWVGDAADADGVTVTPARPTRARARHELRLTWIVVAQGLRREVEAFRRDIVVHGLGSDGVEALEAYVRSVRDGDEAGSEAGRMGLQRITYRSKRF
ncbi:hypothetical protein HK101_000618 [Irineochytrium annulatum]|nr:hypothetical protein HK101_000618 [Irineochytrium annulatum]